MADLLTPQSTDAAIAAAYRGKRVLITGGAGCIGSNLCRSLLEAGAKQVVLLDDLSAGPPWNLPCSDRSTFFHGSVTDSKTLERTLADRPEVVFHLAAFFANQNSVEHPEEDLHTNGLGTLRVLQSAQRMDVSRVVYASSGCAVYNSEAPLPLREEFVTLRLATPYQVTKLLGELYCNFFHLHYGLPVVRARLFNVYGPGEVPGRYRNVIPNFFYWAHHRQPLPITGTGEETRDFTYVEDIVRGLLRCGVLPQAVGEAVNLAGGEETRVLDLAEQINALTGNPAGLRPLERRPWDNHYRRRACLEKARSLLGYHPLTDLTCGLRRTLSWFQGHLCEIEATTRF